MKLYVNDEKIDITLENEKTVNDVLKSFEIEAEKNDATIIGVSLNGESVPAEKIDEVCAAELKDDTCINLRVLSKSAVVEGLKTAKTRLEKLSEELETIPELLQNGKDKDANNIITRLADNIDAFCHTATLSALFPDLYSKISIEGQNVGEYFESFAPIFADLEQSLTSNDTVTSGDLCLYEISPKLKVIAQAVEQAVG